MSAAAMLDAGSATTPDTVGGLSQRAAGGASEAPALAETQRSMQAAILGGPTGQADPEALVDGDATLPARERLALYHRSYVLRLRSCLRDSYPALRHALGDELFDEFADEYVATHPSRARSLSELGAGFPDHLEATRPDAELPRGRREHWPDFLIDLARLERAFCEVYDGPGEEARDAAVRSAPGVGARHGAEELTPIEELAPILEVRAARCLCLLALHYPVDDYMLRIRRGKSPPLPQRAPCSVALGRREFVVTVTRLEPTERALLERLAAGTVIAGEALADAARQAGLDDERRTARLRQWCEAGLLVSIDGNEEGAVRR